MAELVLSSAFQVIFDKLASFGLDKLGNLLDIKVDGKKLKRKLRLVEAVLDDAEEKQVTNRAVETWLSNLKDVAYDAETLLLRIPYNESLKYRIYADDVKDMLTQLEKVADEGLSFSLRERTDTLYGEWKRPRTIGNLRCLQSDDGITWETDSFVIESEVYGREEDKKTMVQLLLSCKTTEEGEGIVWCVPVTGMGGLGKTTLAQLAYNDQKVTQHFDVKVWVSVFHHFDVKNILTTIIESVTEAKWELSSMDSAQKKVRNLLRNKRFLIVLDNVWTEDHGDWDRLRQVIFGTGIDGSKILITSRSKKVEEALRKTGFPTDQYELGELSTEASWSLFKKRAFQRGEEEMRPILLSIGEQIVRKCGGLPLAVKTLGSLMRFKRDVKEWEFVRDSEFWNIDECRSGLLPALKLSYSRLPLHLKRCLVFCSIFPRSYEFNKEYLIHQWIALGLVQSGSRKTGKRLLLGRFTPPALRSMQENFGNEYFIHLEWMSFFQEIKHSENGIVTRYKMHDIIYDLLQYVASSEYAILGHGFDTRASFKRIRHSSVICDFKSTKVPEELYEAGGHNLRTLIFFSQGNLEVLPEKFYSSFTCLFVLNLSGSGLIDLDSSIGALSHLTYLDLSYTHITKLPPQVEVLPLQILKLFNCYNLLALPDLRKMQHLRHLDNEGCRKLTRMLESRRNPPGVDDYGNSFQLQTLPLFVVGGDHDAILLADLILRGSLKVTHLENISSTCLLRFNPQIEIETLGLYWGNDAGCPSMDPEAESIVNHFKKNEQTELSRPSRGIENDVLGNLKPPHILTRLLIKGYSGFKFPSWDLPRLKVVDIISCRQSQVLPVLGNLPNLTSISLREMHGVSCIGKEFYGEGNMVSFPSLQELSLVAFPNLTEWLSPDNGGNAFPSLRKLVVNACPELTVMPQILFLHHLDLQDCRATLLDSFQNLTSLETLIIGGVKDLRCFPGAFPTSNPFLRHLEIKDCPRLCFLPIDLENLAVLKSLVIHSCGQLQFLPESLHYLSALESLEIGVCHSLTSLPDGVNKGLSNLQSLSIESCDNLTSLSTALQYLTSLEILSIVCCPSIVALPPSVKHLSSLRSLRILWCQQLTFLPEELQNMMVLRSLEISGCPWLEVLPEWIGKLVSLRSLVISNCDRITFLPEGMQRLTALQHLSIQDCPQLQQRCRAENGEDWSKIAHVPYKRIELPNL